MFFLPESIVPLKFVESNLYFLLFIDQFQLFSVNRYPPGPPSQRYNSPHREPPHKRFDDVAPPGTEGYYDLPPPGVDHPEKPADRSRELPSKNQESKDRDRGPPRDER